MIRITSYIPIITAIRNAPERTHYIDHGAARPQQIKEFNKSMLPAIMEKGHRIEVRHFGLTYTGNDPRMHKALARFLVYAPNGMAVYPRSVSTMFDMLKNDTFVIRGNERVLFPRYELLAEPLSSHKLRIRLYDWLQEPHLQGDIEVTVSEKKAQRDPSRSKPLKKSIEKLIKDCTNDVHIFRNERKSQYPRPGRIDVRQ